MFTGIVEGMARVTAADAGPSGMALDLDLGAVAADVRVGDSVAVDGCCLTVASLSGAIVRFEAVPQTLGATTLGSLQAGDRVNVERALRFGDRLGGHLVTGHVDAVGRVRAVEPRGDEWAVTIDVPAHLHRFLVPRGSITVDGVSLTLAACTPEGFRVALIPHTRAVTTLGQRSAGDPVNLECDVLARYVGRLLERGRIDGTLALDDF